MKNQSHGWDSYGWRASSATPNESISLWYSNSEYSGARIGMLKPLSWA